MMTRGGGWVEKTPKLAYVIHGCSLITELTFVKVRIHVKDGINYRLIF